MVRLHVQFVLLAHIVPSPLRKKNIIMRINSFQYVLNVRQGNILQALDLRAAMTALREHLAMQLGYLLAQLAH